MHCARAADKYRQDVADGRAVERSDNADAAREKRQRPFEFFIKKTFRREPVAHLLKRYAQSASAHRVERLDNQLVFAARLIDRKSPAHAHLQTVRRAKADAPVDAPETFRVELRRLIFDC